MSKTLRTSCRLMTKFYFSVVVVVVVAGFFFLFTASFTVPFFKSPFTFSGRNPKFLLR